MKKGENAKFMVMDEEWNVIRKGFKTAEAAYEWIALYGEISWCVVKQW